MKTRTVLFNLIVAFVLLATVVAVHRPPPSRRPSLRLSRRPKHPPRKSGPTQT